MKLFQRYSTSALLVAVAASSSGRNVVAAQVQPAFFGASTNTEAYSAWLQQVSYEKAAFLPSKIEGYGVALHWTIAEDRIHLAVAAQATGWVGVGLAESGSMRGADVVMFTTESNQLVDSYILDQLVNPFPDDCQSWTLVNSTVDGGFAIFEANRLLDTGDLQDRAIIDDSTLFVAPTRVIAAWGDTSTPAYHGINNTARGSIRFFETDDDTTTYLESFESTMASKAEGNFTVKADNFGVPAVETVYQNFCFSGADLEAMNVPLDQDLHTIGIEPIVDLRTSKYVHHFVVSASSDPWNSSLDCLDTFPGIDMAYAWAPGDLPLNLPPNVGGPLGSNGFKSFKIEIHYNNPWLDSGMLDSSGVRFYYTSQKRQYDMGVYQTGDPQVALFGEQVSPNGGLVQHSFECGGACSLVSVTEPLTVFREHLHMHASGVSMVNSQIRNGEVIRQGKVQFWDFEQQGNLGVVQPSFDIQPGDGFRTTCNYDATNDKVWGRGSQEEMCIAFLYYYPRQIVNETIIGSVPYMCGLGLGALVAGCDTIYSTTDLRDLSQAGRTFGTAPSTCSSGNAAVVPNQSPSAAPIPRIPIGDKPVADPEPTTSSGAMAFPYSLLVQGMAATAFSFAVFV